MYETIPPIYEAVVEVWLNIHVFTFILLCGVGGTYDRMANPVDLVKVQQQAVVGQHPDIRNGRTFVMLHEIYLKQGVAGEVFT